MYATHPLINIANISIHNNSATVNSYNGIPYRNNTNIGKYIPNYNGNKTTYTPNLLCFTAYNNTVGWSSPYNCVRVTPLATHSVWHSLPSPRAGVSLPPN
jgi:hypothetical protein